VQQNLELKPEVKYGQGVLYKTKQKKVPNMICQHAHHTSKCRFNGDHVTKISAGGIPYPVMPHYYENVQNHFLEMSEQFNKVSVKCDGTLV